MIVTDKEIFIEKYLVSMCNQILHRTNEKNKFDAAIGIDGDEGYGKTTIAGTLGYYLAYYGNRPWDYNNAGNFFFDVEKMIKFAANREAQIIIWDEAALGGLSSQSQNTIQNKLLTLLYIGRKKRHIYMFNIPKIFRLREALISRMLSLINVYSLDGITRGRIRYFNKVDLEAFYNDWRKTKIPKYNKYRTFPCTFTGRAFPLVVNIDAYESNKDKAIASFGNSAKKGDLLDKNKVRLLRIIKSLYLEGKPVTDISKLSDLSIKTIYNLLNEAKIPGFKGF